MTTNRIPLPLPTLDAAGNRLPDQKCLDCGYKMDAATVAEPGGTDAIRPGPGDVTICVKCGLIMIFGEQMSFHRITEQQLRELSLPQQMLLKKAQELIGKRNAQNQ